MGSLMSFLKGFPPLGGLLLLGLLLLGFPLDLGFLLDLASLEEKLAAKQDRNPPISR